MSVPSLLLCFVGKVLFQRSMLSRSQCCDASIVQEAIEREACCAVHFIGHLVCMSAEKTLERFGQTIQVSKAKDREKRCLLCDIDGFNRDLVLPELLLPRPEASWLS